MKLQTRITEKPPVLDTGTLTVPFLGKFSVADFKPAIAGQDWSKYVNPVNAARLVGNITLYK